MILDLYNLQESGETIKSRLAKENVNKIDYINTNLKILQDKINGWETVKEINYKEINYNSFPTKNQLYIKIGYLDGNESEYKNIQFDKPSKGAQGFGIGNIRYEGTAENGYQLCTEITQRDEHDEKRRRYTDWLITNQSVTSVYSYEGTSAAQLIALSKSRLTQNKIDEMMTHGSWFNTARRALTMKALQYYNCKMFPYGQNYNQIITEPEEFTPKIGVSYLFYAIWNFKLKSNLQSNGQDILDLYCYIHTLDKSTADRIGIESVNIVFPDNIQWQNEKPEFYFDQLWEISIKNNIGFAKQISIKMRNEV